jgi:hypothetical protein
LSSSQKTIKHPIATLVRRISRNQKSHDGNLSPLLRFLRWIRLCRHPNTHLIILFFVVECESQHHHPFLLLSIADKRSKNHSRPIKSTSFSLFEVQGVTGGEISGE